MDTVVAKDRVNITDAEWQARCDLAALYRISDMYGWTDTIDTHMTVRVPGEPKCFLINNYGDNFEEITASSLVKMDIDGNVYANLPQYAAPGEAYRRGSWVLIPTGAVDPRSGYPVSGASGGGAAFTTPGAKSGPRLNNPLTLPRSAWTPPRAEEPHDAWRQADPSPAGFPACDAHCGRKPRLEPRHSAQRMRRARGRA